jgi:hypothetical protein
MVERVIPPSHCRNICENAGTRACFEHCAPRRDASRFIPKDIDLKDAPPFPVEGYIYHATPPERIAVEAFYMSKLVERYVKTPDYDDEDYQPLLDDEYWYAILKRDDPIEHGGE